MECSSPPPLTDDQLSAALDQIAAPDVIDHLASCASCAARLQAAQQAEQSLKSALYRWDCPAPQTLADYHVGRASADQERAIVRHLQTCARCSEEMAELVLFMRDEPPLAAPPELWWMDTVEMCGFLPGFYVDIRAQVDFKHGMIRCHASQLRRGTDGGFAPLEALMRRQYTTRGAQAGTAAAEAFRVHHAFKRARAW
jgi:LmbE family N-acetylglucosaminyl deacetylase